MLSVKYLNKGRIHKNNFQICRTVRLRDNLSRSCEIEIFLGRVSFIVSVCYACKVSSKLVVGLWRNWRFSEAYIFSEIKSLMASKVAFGLHFKSKSNEQTWVKNVNSIPIPIPIPFFREWEWECIPKIKEGRMDPRLY